MVGMKGSSVTHYLIDFINFVLYNQDSKDILAVAVDFSKAFNRVNHNIVIELLSDLGIPGWLLRIKIEILENRVLVVSHNGEASSRKIYLGVVHRVPYMVCFYF